MTAKEAIFLLCDEYGVEFADGGQPRTGIRLRINWLEANIPENKIQDYLLQLLRKVKSEYLRKNQLPSIATMESVLTGNSEDLRLEAAEQFQKIVVILNKYRDFSTTNPRIQAGLTAIGGWSSLGMSNISDLPFFMERFVKAYVGCDPEKVVLRIEKGQYSSGKIIFFSDKGHVSELLADTDPVDSNELIDGLSEDEDSQEARY